MILGWIVRRNMKKVNLFAGIMPGLQGKLRAKALTALAVIGGLAWWGRRRVTQRRKPTA